MICCVLLLEGKIVGLEFISVSTTSSTLTSWEVELAKNVGYSEKLLIVKCKVFLAAQYKVINGFFTDFQIVRCYYW